MTENIFSFDFSNFPTSIANRMVSSDRALVAWWWWCGGCWMWKMRTAESERERALRSNKWQFVCFRRSSSIMQIPLLALPHIAEGWWISSVDLFITWIQYESIDECATGAWGFWAACESEAGLSEKWMLQGARRGSQMKIRLSASVIVWKIQQYWLKTNLICSQQPVSRGRTQSEIWAGAPVGRILKLRHANMQICFERSSWSLDFHRIRLINIVSRPWADFK